MTICKSTLKSKKWLLVMATVMCVPFLMFQFLTLSGFCYGEMRYLSDRELVDRMLFSGQADTLSFVDKVQAMHERDRSEYPENCRIVGYPFWLSGGEKFLNGLFGRRFYQVDCISPPLSDAEAYRYEMLSINSCGQKIKRRGETVSKGVYDSILKKNIEYWEERK